ncbi:hypothetical protein C823_007908 [Eubacterium plexicaudatum ASF492]|nr:hypothetical protein C823_007908 [Eubacterium plexicaudatum ASF492]
MGFPSIPLTNRTQEKGPVPLKGHLRDDVPPGLLKGHKGYRTLYRTPRHGQILRPALLCKEPQSKPLPHGVHLPLHRQRHGILPPALLCPGARAKGRQAWDVPRRTGADPLPLQGQEAALLLAVDEAQYLSTGILEDIKMLMNYGYDSLNCFTLILCGEPHLNSTLKKPVHEALRQRITVHYNFSGLSDSEVAQYILHKIACAGGAASIIDQAALSAVHSHSQGSPAWWTT